jgi:hypothetical protein
MPLSERNSELTVGGSEMASNELVGIAGVFVLTFCLIALYHFIGTFGRRIKRYAAQTERAKHPEQDDPRKSSGKDDAWLLWSPELDERAGPSNTGFRDNREARGSGYVRESH